VLTGFGSSAPNVPAAGGTPALPLVLNNFNWGLDNRIHGATAGIGGTISASNWPNASPVSLAGSDFSFDPRSLAVFPRAARPIGPDVGQRGREFVSDFARPLRQVMYEPRYIARNPFSRKRRNCWM